MKKLLRLRHQTYAGHNETWELQSDGNIFVNSFCPSNSPSHATTVFTPIQALRQYALLTSPVEGWEVEKDYGWHSFVDALEV